MDKALWLGLPILLCCYRTLSGSFANRNRNKLAYHVPVDRTNLLDILQCRMCHLQFPGESCSRGRGVCIAAAEEACVIGRIFRNDGSLWLTFMGCLRSCANVDGIKWGIYLVNFRCCRGHDLCNEPEEAAGPSEVPYPT